MALVARQDIPLFNASTEGAECADDNSIERNIEDAIVETIKTGDRKPRVYHDREEANTIFISQIREQLISNQNDADLSSSSQRLSVFSQASDIENKKPVLSQALLALAICAFAAAILLPVLWAVSSHVEKTSTMPDARILTGSIGLAGSLKGAENLPEDPSETIADTVILDMPIANKAANEGHVVRINRGLSAGSIIYVNPN